MRTLAGLQSTLGGRASLEDEDIAAMRPQTRARRIAVVLTERAASPGLTVDDVVSLGRQPFTGWQGRLTAEDRDRVRAALDMTGAPQFAARLFDDLSNGERQRVMIARAIAQSPRLMVLDKITAFLDLAGRVEVMALLRAHARATGAIILLSSHDLHLSLRLADSVWLLDGRGTLATARFTSPFPATVTTARAVADQGATVTGTAPGMVVNTDAFGPSGRSSPTHSIMSATPAPSSHIE